MFAFPETCRRLGKRVFKKLFEDNATLTALFLSSQDGEPDAKHKT